MMPEGHEDSCCIAADLRSQVVTVKGIRNPPYLFLASFSFALSFTIFFSSAAGTGLS